MRQSSARRVVPRVSGEAVFPEHTAAVWRPAMTAAGQCVWQRGLLRKGVGLCHGISGNAYALLALHVATGDAIWLNRAHAFASFAAEQLDQLQEKPERPLSLWNGAGGLVSLVLDLEEPAAARMPGFEF